MAERCWSWLDALCVEQEVEVVALAYETPSTGAGEAGRAGKALRTEALR